VENPRRSFALVEIGPGMSVLGDLIRRGWIRFHTSAAARDVASRLKGNQSSNASVYLHDLAAHLAVITIRRGIQNPG
jgi:hypothetical protein